ncbi:hypothetical protein D3C79_669470 [compost metagenome]
MHHHIGDRQGLRDLTAERHSDIAGEMLARDLAQVVDQVIDLGVAVGTQHDRDLCPPVVVIDVGREVLRIP